MEKLNPSFLSYNLVENCPFLVLMFRAKNVATLSFAFCFFNSNTTGWISLKVFLNTLQSFTAIRSSINLYIYPNLPAQ